MKKRRIIIGTVLLLVLCTVILSLPTFCKVSDSDVVVSLTIGSKTMQVNGKPQPIDGERDTVPEIIDNRILVPVRAIIEAFGGNADWDPQKNSIVLSMDGITMRLKTEESIAYINSEPKTMYTAPTVINGRTMLPVRFVAEGFNLGVAWEQDEKRVTIISNGFDENEYKRLKGLLPEYSGKPYAVINDNKPFFEDYELIGGSFEYYSGLDELGRCDVCMASVGDDLMPTEKRESISSVIPTGWENEPYDWVDGRYVYNRCHLIGFQLTGENANKRNLITGTRYMNVEGMLPFENMIDDYVDSTDDNVVYRVTPVFSGDNLVADGVLLEAYSVGGTGDGLSFCVYCYNVQPGVIIDYKTGKNKAENANKKSEIKPEQKTVFVTKSGKKYHFSKSCCGKNAYEADISEAISSGRTPCEKCANQ